MLVRRRPEPTLSRVFVASLVLGWLIAVSACSNRADTSAASGSGASSTADAIRTKLPLGPVPALEPGERFADVTFRTIDGRTPRLDAFDGPVLVNFWATSCTVCLEEAPALVALREKLVARGYEMISVAMPYDRPDAVLELATANGWTQPVAIDLDGAVLAAFEPVIGTPTNLLLASDGTLVERYVGRIDLVALESRVLELLDEY